MEQSEPTQASALEAQQSAMESPAPVNGDDEPAARPGVDFELGEDLERAALTTPYRRRPGDPLFRPLRIFTSDPMRSRFEGGETIVSIPYETLRPGPSGHLVEVVEDQANGIAPVDLEASAVQLNSGLAASASSPQFRQQMVYAVAVDVIAQFSLALGREPTWGFTRKQEPGVLRLRPHYARVDNAFYSKSKGEICFGFFPAAESESGRVLPGRNVYASLSQDVIAHEMAHALLDGMRSHFDDSSNADVYAFHEAFADLVATLHHFSHMDSIRRGFEQGAGRLGGSFIFSLAAQFGEAMGYNGPLRSMLRKADAARNAEGARNPQGLRKYPGSEEPHERGGILVEAVLEAMETVFERRVRKIRTIYALSGMPGDELHPSYRDLLADEAARVASQFLSLCIRAIDYCPPVDITFGEYLRALVTADRDLVESDPWGYRECLIAAFGRRAIFPQEVADLGEDSLLWDRADRTDREIVIPRLGLTRLALGEDPGWGATSEELREQAAALAAKVTDPEFADCFAIDPNGAKPSIESIRTLRRVGPDRQIRFGIVAEVLQRRRVSFGGEERDIWAGATVILGSGGEVRYIVHKRADDETRLEREFAFRKRPAGAMQANMRGGELWERLHAAKGAADAKEHSA
ncbi:MAG TPA: hypothetical protein VGW34_03125 [Allosphingosinicella sp.]|nr:hypothetical protein [Allosphingosinicella sp.]